jgi:UDP-glucose 4-epimerase
VSSCRALVTGASGFVGANLVRHLLAGGDEVHLLLRPARDSWRLADLLNHVHVHHVDLRDAGSVSEAVRSIRPTWVFHLAAYGAYSQQDVLREAVQTNIVGTLHLSEACLAVGFDAFVHAGSSSEYGFKDHPPAETEGLDPNSHYAVTKASATLLLRQLAVSRGAQIVTLRLYSVYGPYEEPTRFIPRLAVDGLRGQLPPLVNPDVARDFVHVDDVCDAFLAAACGQDQAPGAVYNVGSGVQTTIRMAVEVARELIGIQQEPSWGSMPDRRWDTSTWVADTRLIRERLDWSPQHAFEDGFASIVDWFRRRPHMMRRYAERQAV